MAADAVACDHGPKKWSTNARRRGLVISSEIQRKWKREVRKIGFKLCFDSFCEISSSVRPWFEIQHSLGLLLLTVINERLRLWCPLLTAVPDASCYIL
jgi:hypothetical protein